MNGFYFLFDQVDYNLIFNKRELFEISFYFLSKFEFFVDLFFEKISYRDGSKFIVISDLKSEFPDLKSRGAYEKYFFDWVKIRNTLTLRIG